MIIKSSIRSSKSDKTATGAVNYILSDKDHAGKKRSIKPKVVFGDADLVRSYDKTPEMRNKKNKSTSGVIALRDTEKLNSKQKRQLVSDFQELVLPKKYRNNVDMLVVEHNDKGNTELHFVIPHLTIGGYNFNPFPCVGRDQGKNSHEAVKAMTRVLNYKYGFNQVVDTPQKVAEFKHLKYANTKTEDGRRLLKEEKQNFNSSIQKRIKEYSISNRDELISHLEKQGYQIKAYDNRTTFTTPKTKRKITLYGGLYGENGEDLYKGILSSKTGETIETKPYTQADYENDLNTVNKWHSVLEAKFNPKLTSKQQNTAAFQALKEFQQGANITVSGTNNIKANNKTKTALKQPQEAPQQPQQQTDNNIGTVEITATGTASAIDTSSPEVAVNQAMSALKEAEAKFGPNSPQAKTAKTQLQQAQKALAVAQEAKARELDEQRKRYRPKFR